MSDVTRILSAIEQGDPQAAEQLLPLVYEELRRLAAQKMAQEQPGQTLDATALVHEAYLRLVDAERRPAWDNRGHFFAAAAEAMRRILVDNARSKRSLKRGGGRKRVALDANVAGRRPLAKTCWLWTRRLPNSLLGTGQGRSWSKLHFFAGLTLPRNGRSTGDFAGDGRALLGLCTAPGCLPSLTTPRKIPLARIFDRP